MVDYKSLKGQYIDGEWCDGSSLTVMENRNPYNDELITSTHSANKEDLNNAYKMYENAQKIYGKINKIEKRKVIENTVNYIEANYNNIVDIMMQELGATKLKADFEIGLVINMIKEASTFPSRMVGKIEPSMIDD